MGIKKEGKKKKDQNVIFHQKTKPDDETYKSGAQRAPPIAGLQWETVRRSYICHL